MPADVVRLPLSTAPVARISGSFSFEEGGVAVKWLSLLTIFAREQEEKSFFFFSFFLKRK